MLLLKSLSIFLLFLPLLASAQPQPTGFKGWVYVTHKGNIIPGVDKLDRYNGGSSALSYGKFKVYFESQVALDNFTQHASIVKNIQAGQCFEYLIHKDKVISYLRYNLNQDCSDAPLIEPLSCKRLKDSYTRNPTTISSKHRPIFGANELEKDCIGKLLYQFTIVNKMGEELNCTREIDLLHKVQDKIELYPDTNENKSLHDYRLVTNSGTLLYIQKAPAENTYHSRTEDGVFFESEKVFKKTDVTVVKEEGAFMDKCYKVYTLKPDEGKEKEVLRTKPNSKYCEQI